MNNTNLKKKIKGVNRNPTKEYSIAITILIFSLIVFYTSKIWLPDVDKIQNTKFGTKLRVSPSVELTLYSWEYNPTTHFMEVIFNITESKNFNQNKFNAVAKVSSTKKIPAEVILNENSLMVVHIKKVPKKFSVVSLWINQIEENSQSENNNKVNYKCDYRKVKSNSNLKAKSKKEYVLFSVKKEIEIVKENIQNAKCVIEDKQNEIKLLNNDIDILKSDMKYQTEDEIQKTNSNIENKYRDIEILKSEIENENNKISSLNEKISKLNIKLKDKTF